MAVLAVLALAPVSQVMAMPTGHPHPVGDPWAATNCVVCHGADLRGSIGPSCMTCHNDFVEPDLPELGHHMPGREDPLANCVFCHGGDLTGSVGPSCFTCHDDVWSGGGGNSPPDVDHGGPYAGAPGQPIQFDASGTSDADGDTLFYVWLSFGDGTPAQFPSPVPTITHTYAAPGTYTVKLSVTDGVNIPVVVETTAVMGAANLPPSADAGGPYSGIAGQAVQFDASGSSDPDGDTLIYSWDFGDGNPITLPGPNPGASHTYQSAGTYTAVLRVDDGVNTPVSVPVQVEIGDDAPPPGSVDGELWDVKIPYLGAEMLVEFEEFAGILLVQVSSFSDPPAFGLGMEVDGVIFWMDSSGAIFFGNINRADGTMRGIVFDYYGGSSIWFAELL
jgi:hypothetical protein